MSGLAGAILASRIATGAPNAGKTYELNVIAAVVIGRGSLSGGPGITVGTIIDSLIMGVLENGGNIRKPKRRITPDEKKSIHSLPFDILGLVLPFDGRTTE